jgi:hypothetical protein
VTTIFGFHKPPVQAVCKSPGKSTLTATTKPDPVASDPPTTALAGIGKSPINKEKIAINELDIFFICCKTTLMESLALLVSLILLSVLLFGPIAIGFSFASKKMWARILTFFFGSLAIITGIWLAGLTIGIGARLMGVFAIACGIWAIYRRRIS